MACFKWHIAKRRRKIAPTGRTPWNRDGFDSLDCSGFVDDWSGFSAASRVRKPAGRRTRSAGNRLPDVGRACGNCGYQLLRGIAVARLANCRPSGPGTETGVRAVDLLATKMITRMA